MDKKTVGMTPRESIPRQPRDHQNDFFFATEQTTSFSCG